MGFLVLSFGAIAVLAMLLVGVLSVWLAAKSQETRRRKWIASGVALLIVALIPTWDEIYGRLYFSYLCATDAGVHINKTVDLGPERANMQAFPDLGIRYERLALAKQYPYGSASIDDLPGPARISRTREFVVEAKTGDVLGEIIEYWYGGGWFDNLMSFGHAGGKSCTAGGHSFRKFLDQIFP